MSSGLFFISCQLLAIGGAMKIVSPSPTGEAWESLGFPSSFAFVRIVGFLELSSALSATAIGGELLPLVVGSWYALFFLVTFRLFRMPESPPCGCFGSSNTPASIRHIIMNFFFMAFSVFAIGTNGLSTEIRSSDLNNVLYLLLIIGGAGLSYLLLIMNRKSFARFTDSQ